MLVQREGSALCYIPRHGGVHGECRVGVSEAPRRDGIHMLALPEDRRVTTQTTCYSKIKGKQMVFSKENLQKK